MPREREVSMRIFLAGATGALGMRLLPRLIAAGHQVTATTRTAAKVDALRALGATPALVDALDRQAVLRAVREARPEVVVHQLTALAHVRNLKNFDREFTQTNRLRTEAVQHLLDGAREVGARRFVAQSYTGWPSGREGGRVKTERDPLDTHPLKTMTKTLDAIRWLESTMTGLSSNNGGGLEGIALRYGSFYGPGTSTAIDGEIVTLVRKRQMPVVGDGAGVWSFIHIDDAAEATQLAIEGRGGAGLFNIVDDEPAEVAVWLPELARAVGAPPPRRIPAWVAKLMIGEALVMMMTKVRGSSNALAKRALGWQPKFASWRDGFHRGLA